MSKTNISKNANVATIPTKPGISFYYKWLSFLIPFHKLTDRERQVLAGLLNKRHELKRLISDDNMLDNLMKQPEVRKEVREELNIGPQQFNVLYSKLRAAGVIVGDKINKKYIPNIEHGSKEYKLVLIFEVNGGEADIPK